MPRWIVLPFLVLPFVIVSCRVTSTRPDAAVPATTTAPVVSATPEAAARDWLALVDRGQWEAAYEVMIPMFREAVSLAEWRATVLQARPQNAGQGERVLVSSASGTDMFPDAVQLTFRTGSALETVTLLPRDGRWLVVGYIFPAVGGASAPTSGRTPRFESRVLRSSTLTPSIPLPTRGLSWLGRHAGTREGDTAMATAAGTRIAVSKHVPPAAFWTVLLQTPQTNASFSDLRLPGSY
jgi:hypothetical protein